MVEKFATGVADTGGKFATGVVDTGGNLPPVSLTPVANLPPVSALYHTNKDASHPYLYSCTSYQTLIPYLIFTFPPNLTLTFSVIYNPYITLAYHTTFYHNDYTHNPLYQKNKIFLCPT
jgi:hypothetical protein